MTVFGLNAIEKSGGGGGGSWITGEPPPQLHAANGNRPSNEIGAQRRSRPMKKPREQRPLQEMPHRTKESAACEEAALISRMISNYKFLSEIVKLRIYANGGARAKKNNERRRRGVRAARES